MVTTTEVETTRSTLRPPTPREARLRPEHGREYPEIPPGRWESAATVADRVLAGWLLRGNLLAIRGRVLLEEHFEFRGGTERGGERGGARPRPEGR
jgi:hypothetical protein